jgi:phosphatidate cytidylyltransferase
MLKTRVLTAVVVLALFLAALFLLPEKGWIACCALILAAAAWEWGGLAVLAMPGRCIYAALIVALFLIPAVTGVPRPMLMPVWTYFAAAIFWIFLAPFWIWLGPRAGSRSLVLAAGVVALVPAFAALADLRAARPEMLLGVLAAIWISDSAAYLIGRRFGRHKLAPSISPGKSWEGVAAALIAVALYAFGWAYWGGPASMPAWADGKAAGIVTMVLVLLGFAVAGMIGDLFESLIKRHAGVKDSGTLLPGHGGILDRIDAPVAVLPLAVMAFIR